MASCHSDVLFEVLQKDMGWATGQGKTMNVTNVTRVFSSKRIKRRRRREGLPWWSVLGNPPCKEEDAGPSLVRKLRS